MRTLLQVQWLRRACTRVGVATAAVLLAAVASASPVGAAPAPPLEYRSPSKAEITADGGPHAIGDIVIAPRPPATVAAGPTTPPPTSTITIALPTSGGWTPGDNLAFAGTPSIQFNGSPIASSCPATDPGDAGCMQQSDASIVIQIEPALPISDVSVSGLEVSASPSLETARDLILDVSTACSSGAACDRGHPYGDTPVPCATTTCTVAFVSPPSITTPTITTSTTNSPSTTSTTSSTTPNATTTTPPATTPTTRPHPDDILGNVAAGVTVFAMLLGAAALAMRRLRIAPERIRIELAHNPERKGLQNGPWQRGRRP